jgi:uroporphyrinogen decarboxylase
LNSKERLINAILRKEVDRIPTFEWSIDKNVINGILPDASEEDFIYKMNIDAFVVEVDYKKYEIAPGIFKNEWGVIERTTSETHTISAEGCIKNFNDLRKINPPDVKASYRFNTLEKMIKKHSGEKAIILRLNDVLSIPRNLLGYENLFINIATNPDFVKNLVDISAEYNIALAKEAVKKGAEIVFTGDDYAYDKGLLISPEAFNEIFYPGFKKVIKSFKDSGLLVIKHTDGNIWDIIDKLIEAGIDCLDPIDPTSGMDILSVKTKYGDKISIKGNVNCAYTLSLGTIEETIAETKKCIKDGTYKYKYGYILSSSNSIHSSVKPENYKVMLDTLMKYGKYPI